MSRIKLGISLKSLGLPFRRSLPQALKLGANGIELEAAGELLPQNLTQTGRREILHLLRSHDLSVGSVVCPLRRGLDEPENLEPRLEQIRLTMALAFELGPRAVIIQPGQVVAPNAEKADVARAQLMKESLEALGKHGDRTGVMVALDTGHDEPAALVAYLNQLDVGSLGVNYNPANLVASGHNAYAAISTFQRRIVHAHALDARRINPSKVATVPVGHGDIDWMQLLASFEEVEYRGYLTVLGEDQAELAAGVAFLKRFVV